LAHTDCMRMRLFIFQTLGLVFSLIPGLHGRQPFPKVFHFHFHFLRISTASCTPNPKPISPAHLQLSLALQLIDFSLHRETESAGGFRTFLSAQTARLSVGRGSVTPISFHSPAT
jgi:hypothetical protein